MKVRTKTRSRKKPWRWSVTSIPCKCDQLQRAAAEPEDAIAFDEEMHEYHITSPRGGYLVIFHCPFCGGVAPRSKREERFATVSHAEAARLEALTSRLRTVKAAIAALGKPASDVPNGVRTYSRPTSKTPSQITSYRMLTFTGLSSVADVDLIDYGVQGLRFSFRGKYLGKRREQPGT